MEYRMADVSDISELARLRTDMLCEYSDHSEEFRGMMLERTKKHLEDGMQDGSFVSWTAREDGRIVAMGGAAFFCLPPNDWCPGGKTAYIGNMYTIPEFRRQGVASRLLEHMISDIKRRGCERILLYATDSGRPLYEKHGFEPSAGTMALYPFGIMPVL
jgi:GNAT superfamily N-acetyltransferase